VSAAAGELDAGGEVAEEPVQPEELVAAAHALPAGVHQREDGARGVVADRAEHLRRERQGALDPELRAADAAHDGDVALGPAPDPADETAAPDDTATPTVEGSRPAQERAARRGPRVAAARRLRQPGGGGEPGVQGGASVGERRAEVRDGEAAGGTRVGGEDAGDVAGVAQVSARGGATGRRAAACERRRWMGGG